MFPVFALYKHKFRLGIVSLASGCAMAGPLPRPLRVLAVVLAPMLSAGPFGRAPLALASVADSRSEGPLARPAKGDPFRARLSAVDANWQVLFDVAGKPRSLPAGDVVCWGGAAEPRRGPLVVLADGSLLVADVTSAGRDTLRAESGLLGPVSIPLDGLCGVVVHAPADSLERDLLVDRVQSASGSSDRVVLTNGDEIAGSIGAIREGKARLETRVGPVDVELARVRALVYNPTLLKRPRPAGLRAWVGLSDGSRLLATSLTVDTKSVRLGLAGGLAWKTSAADLVFLQPLGGRVTYLSDLQATHRQVPFLDLPWPYRADRNVLGGMLRTSGRLWLKGLGTHSASRLSYTLAGQYRSFQAELGVDDAASGGGSVGFRVFVDGQQKYASPIVRGDSPPLSLSVDVTGAQGLDLVVDFADRADELDYANWLDARLVR
jgi:hypothetical protein